MTLGAGGRGGGRKGGLGEAHRLLGGGNSLIGTVVSHPLTGQNSLNCTLKTCAFYH